MIVRLEEPALAREYCADLARRGIELGFVPTMGALHEGHVSLVARAVRENERVCVSVFVNPLQFNERADFERYPRDFERDARLLESTGCHMVFTGTIATFFPGELAPDGTLVPEAVVDPGPCARGLEGARRPGHFAGVATIVERLFRITEPRRAYFGRKDFQQTLVVGDLARRIGFPEIVVCPTSREASGLARSSRNELLSPAERARATVLYRALRAAREAWVAGERDARTLGARMRAELAREAADVDYAEVRDPARWTAAEPDGPVARAIALIAARVGAVRLIDNMALDEPEESAS